MKTRTRKRRAKKQQRAVPWAAATLGSVALADQRLSVRAVRILARKASRPGDSIPHAARTPADAKAWYRFLENERVAAAELWDPIHQHTAKGLGGLVCVLLGVRVLEEDRPAASGQLQRNGHAYCSGAAGDEGNAARLIIHDRLST